MASSSRSHRRLGVYGQRGPSTTNHLLSVFWYALGLARPKSAICGEHSIRKIQDTMKRAIPVFVGMGLGALVDTGLVNSCEINTWIAQ